MRVLLYGLNFPPELTGIGKKALCLAAQPTGGSGGEGVVPDGTTYADAFR